MMFVYMNAMNAFQIQEYCRERQITCSLKLRNVEKKEAIEEKQGLHIKLGASFRHQFKQKKRKHLCYNYKFDHGLGI